MASMMKMLIDEFYVLKDAALGDKNYERAQFFEQAVSYANNTHGFTEDEIIEYMNKMLSVSYPFYTEDEESARKDSLEIVQVFADVLDERKVASS